MENEMKKIFTKLNSVVMSRARALSLFLFPSIQKLIAVQLSKYTKYKLIAFRSIADDSGSDLNRYRQLLNTVRIENLIN